MASISCVGPSTSPPLPVCSTGHCYFHSLCGGTTLPHRFCMFFLPEALSKVCVSRQTFLGRSDFLCRVPSSECSAGSGEQREALPQVYTSLTILEMRSVNNFNSKVLLWGSFSVGLLLPTLTPSCVLPCPCAWATGICHRFSLGGSLTSAFQGENSHVVRGPHWVLDPSLLKHSWDSLSRWIGALMMDPSDMWWEVALVFSFQGLPT